MRWIKTFSPRPIKSLQSETRIICLCFYHIYISDSDNPPWSGRNLISSQYMYKFSLYLVILHLSQGIYLIIVLYLFFNFWCRFYLVSLGLPGPDCQVEWVYKVKRGSLITNRGFDDLLLFVAISKFGNWRGMITDMPMEKY